MKYLTSLFTDYFLIPFATLLPAIVIPFLFIIIFILFTVDVMGYFIQSVVRVNNKKKTRVKILQTYRVLKVPSSLYCEVKRGDINIAEFTLVTITVFVIFLIYRKLC